MIPNQHARYDHVFRAIHDDEIPWQEGSKSYLKLPGGACRSRFLPKTTPWDGLT